MMPQHPKASLTICLLRLELYFYIPYKADHSEKHVLVHDAIGWVMPRLYDNGFIPSDPIRFSMAEEQCFLPQPFTLSKNFLYYTIN